MNTLEANVMGRGAEQFKIRANFPRLNISLRAMVDSGAMGNFISKTEVLRHKIATRVKKDSY